MTWRKSWIDSDSCLAWDCLMLSQREFLNLIWLYHVHFESDCFWRSWFNICTYSSYLFEQVNCCGWEPSLHPLPSTWPHFPRYLGSRKDTLHSLTHTDSMTSTARILAFKLSPPSQDGSPERLFSCDEDIERRYEVVPSVVCSMCCLFGIIYCFFGRLQRMNELIIFRLQTAEHTGLEKCRFT